MVINLNRPSIGSGRVTARDLDERQHALAAIDEAARYEPALTLSPAERERMKRRKARASDATAGLSVVLIVPCVVVPLLVLLALRLA